MPCEWHTDMILRNAYKVDVPNRDIMGHLYISEGGFNRQRRRGLQAVARVMYEASLQRRTGGPERVHMDPRT